MTGDLNKPVYPKNPDAPICACFGLTRQDIEQDVSEGVVTREDEVSRRCGSRYERVSGETVTRYGHQRGVAVIAGQKLPIARPRMRYTRRCGEADLERPMPNSSRPTPCPRPC